MSFDPIRDCDHERTSLVVDGLRECVGPGRLLRLLAWERVASGARSARAVCEMCGSVLANARPLPVGGGCRG